MIQVQCKNCIFWKTENQQTGSCHRATGTTAESACGSGMPAWTLDTIKEKVLAAILPELTAQMAEMIAANAERKEASDNAVQGKRQRKQKGREEDAQG